MKIRKFLAVLLTAVLAVSTAVSALSVSAFAADKVISYVVSYQKEYPIVTITPGVSTNTIRYTTNGKTPTASSKKYTKELRCKSSMTIIASEFNKNGKIVGTVKISVKLRCLPVVFSLRSDKNGNNYVKISTSTKNASIYYTTNGSEPKVGSSKTKLYSGEFKCASGKTIKAVAVKKNYKNSTVASVKIGSRVDEAISDTTTSNVDNPAASDADISLYREAVSLIFDAHNSERGKKSLPALSLDKTLCDAAQKRSKEIAENYSIGHTRPNGDRWDTVLNEFGYVATAVGENLGWCGGTGYTDQKAAEKIMTMWMNSAVHKANILGNFIRVGFGCTEIGGKYYFAVLFSN